VALKETGSPKHTRSSNPRNKVTFMSESATLPQTLSASELKETCRGRNNSLLCRFKARQPLGGLTRNQTKDRILSTSEHKIKS